MNETDSVQTDVVIVGASVAGSAAATLFARQGLKVLLVDRALIPDAYKKQCSHAIQPGSVPVLERLGVADELEREGARKSWVQIWTRAGGWVRLASDSERDAEGHRLHGFNIRREKLDPLLRRTAVATDGVTLRLGTSVRSLRKDATGRVTGVELSDAAGNVTCVDAKLVVGADGRNTKVAELAGIPAALGAHNRGGFMGYYRGVKNLTGDDAQFWILGEDVAYSFPTDDGLVLIAAVVNERRLPEFRADREGFLRRMVSQLPDGPDLSGAERVGDFVGVANTPNTYRWPAAAGLALIGDAAMASDYIWGVGCGWALQGAELLADRAGPALVSGGAVDVDAALEAYAKAHKALLHSQHVQNIAFSASSELPAILRAVFTHAPHDARLHELLVLSSLGRISQRDLRVPLRLAWLMLTKPFRGARPPAPVRRPKARGASGSGAGVAAPVAA